MKKIILIFVLFSTILFLSCSDDDDSDDFGDRDFKQDMRDFVQGISIYAKNINSNFNVIPQNGHELLTEDGETDGPPATEYINYIDGVGREDLFYGYDDDNVPTSQSDTEYMMAFMDVAENNGVKVLVTDYCWTQAYVDSSYLHNVNKGYISFAADHRELDNIPAYPAEPYNVNNSDILELSEIKNFLYLINPDNYASKNDFIDAVTSTNYDLLIMDLFFHDETEFSSSEIDQLKSKSNGGSRLLICYMSIGEAEDYRYYWQDTWAQNPPEWLDEENPDWGGNYKVRYWDSDWQDIIFGNDDSYLKKILDAGFDGVYLDIIDAFEYFED